MNSLTRLLCRVSIAATAIVFTSLAANAQAPDAKTKATGSISGRVTIGGKAAREFPWPLSAEKILTGASLPRRP